MAKSHMLSAVIQALALSVLERIISHHLWTHAGEYFNESTRFQDLFNAAAAVGNNTAAKQNHPEYSVNITTSFINGSSTSNNYTVPASNLTTTGTNSTSVTDAAAATSFYKHDLPHHLLFLLIIMPLSYYWQIWLERTVPGRLKVQDFPPPSSSAAPEKASFGDDDDGKEEAIVQKWIAQGKVKRASLSWWNTFVKWVLELSVGGLWQVTIGAVLSFIRQDWKLVVLKKNVVEGWIKWEILIRWLWSFVGIRPLASLVSFIVIPAHQRIVFLEGAELVTTTFFGLFVKALLPWLEGTEFVQVMIANMTDAANKQQGGGSGLGTINMEL
ncbi:hypothetical protein Slin15195_G073970 [Septoria linicola]|uniref:Uncharacterized protein n=1 Tax=Septoria linicola TaxID=215465 RepID=A0A9Q9EM46_9PEZI|nr:hypothetical protein Slin14017_G035100 [Septoria linicola]USW54078.1 hypothetical protein Slin15195_G073970 [Septoria linicola]